jgi:hypothetical protein
VQDDDAAKGGGAVRANVGGGGCGAEHLRREYRHPERVERPERIERSSA